MQFILLGAVPFPSDVPRLKQLGVRGVVTLNEPYETLVPTSLYQVKISVLTWLHDLSCFHSVVAQTPLLPILRFCNAHASILTLNIKVCFHTCDA
jgi:hypothetical protein